MLLVSYFRNRNLFLHRFLPRRRWQSQESTGSGLKEILMCKIKSEQENVKRFRQQFGDRQIGKVTINAIYGGLRGVPGLVYETSLLDSEEGIRFRGLSIPDILTQLPRAEDGCQPLPEALFWLLLTGEVPTVDQTRALSKEWAFRSEVPTHVVQMLEHLPKDTHPMAQLVAASAACSICSKFALAYHQGTPKGQYWEYVYEDGMDLLAKLPVIAGVIYINTFKDGNICLDVDKTKDWSYNFAQVLGFKNNEFADLLRLYLTVHSDHEGGNVSAHTVHLVGSALSDPYLAYAAGMCGLAGPLHGLASQETLDWLSQLSKKVGKDPSEDAVKNYVNETLKSGKVIPGFGHAVLRKTDPRYMAFREFGLKHLPDDPMMKLTSTVYKVVPPILQSIAKIQNPWPNVDAHSGVLLQHYGMTETTFYTVMFGVSRALGVLASLIWSRALGLPIERPKSLTTETLMKMAKGGNKAQCAK